MKFYLDIIKQKLIGTVINKETSFSFLHGIIYSVKFESLINENKEEINFGSVVGNTEFVYIYQEQALLNVKSINYQDIGVGDLEKEFAEIAKSLFLTRIIPEKFLKTWELDILRDV